MTPPPWSNAAHTLPSTAMNSCMGCESCAIASPLPRRAAITVAVAVHRSPKKLTTIWSTPGRPAIASELPSMAWVNPVTRLMPGEMTELRKNVRTGNSIEPTTICSASILPWKLSRAILNPCWTVAAVCSTPLALAIAAANLSYPAAPLFASATAAPIASLPKIACRVDIRCAADSPFSDLFNNSAAARFPMKAPLES